MKRDKSDSLILDNDYVKPSAMILSFFIFESIWHHTSALRYNQANADLFLEWYETDTNLVWKKRDGSHYKRQMTMIDDSVQFISRCGQHLFYR